jgi:Tol biopolymer transport system component
VIVSAILAATTSTPAHAAFPGKNGRIAFAVATPVPGQVFDGRDIWTMKPDGTDRVPLTSHPRWDILPDWSPDGGKIVFISLRSGGFNIWTMNADGTRQTQLTFSDDVYFPTWSPDGTQIVFERDRSVGVELFTDLWIMNSDGGNAHRIEGTGDRAYQPAWSPDGTRIAYSSFAPGDIYTIKPDGTDRRKVISDRNHDSFAPDWSPDGRRIVFQRRRTYETYFFDIWVANADGSSQARVAEFGELPAFSPDASQISFSRYVYPERQGVYVMNADGSNQRRLADSGDSSYISRPDWGPVPEPRRDDYKNGPAYCRALRDHLGEAEFRQRFGGGTNAFGKCVSGK